jgi:hypothetical protein
MTTSAVEWLHTHTGYDNNYIINLAISVWD